MASIMKRLINTTHYHYTNKTDNPRGERHFEYLYQVLKDTSRAADSLREIPAGSETGGGEKTGRKGEKRRCEGRERTKKKLGGKEKKRKREIKRDVLPLHSKAQRQGLQRQVA